MVKKADVILLIFIIISALIILSVFIFIPKTSGNTLIISVDNKEYLRAPLNKDAVIELESNTVVIKNGEAYMKEAECRDKICVNSGKISKKGESIICLPAKVILFIHFSPYLPL